MNQRGATILHGLPLLSFLSPSTTRRLRSLRHIIRAISTSSRSRQKRANIGSPFPPPLLSSLPLFLSLFLSLFLPLFSLTFLPLTFRLSPSPFSPTLLPSPCFPSLLSHLAPPNADFGFTILARFPAVNTVHNSPAPPYADSRPIWAATLPCCRLNQRKATNSMGEGEVDGGNWQRG